MKNFTHNTYELTLKTTDDGLASHYFAWSEKKGRGFSIDVEEVGIDQDKLRKIIDEQDKKISNSPKASVEEKISLLDKFIEKEFEKFIDGEIDQQEFFKKAKEYRTYRAKLLRKFYINSKQQQK